MGLSPSPAALRLLQDVARAAKRGNGRGVAAVREGKPAARGRSAVKGRAGGRRLAEGATRLGDPPTATARGTPSLARAPGRPGSPWRGGRAHSAARGAGSGGVTPARGDSKSGSRTTTRG